MKPWEQSLFSTRKWNNMTTRYLFRLATVVLVAVTMSACTTVHKNFKPFIPILAQQENAPAKVAVVLPEALCSFYYDNGDLTAFDLGPVICQNARNAAERAFSNPLVEDTSNARKVRG
jgi:hypothetical protein